MKIVYVYPHFVEQAGTERVLIDKMNYLAREYGYEVIMLTNEQGLHPLSYPLDPLVRHVDLNIRFTHLFRQNRLVRFFKWEKYNRILRKAYNAFIRETNPDIVVASTYHSNWMSIVGDNPMPYVRVLESHIDKRFILNNDPLNQRSLLRWLHTAYQMNVVNRKARRFDVLVALMDEDAKDWSKYVRSVVIKNVVHLNDTGQYGSLQAKRVIFVGRYTEQKGIFDLFDIWEMVHKRYPDWHLDLYGEGHLRKDLEAEADRLRMNIHVNKPDKDIFKRYLESSLFVLPSLYEPFGLVMPEAMSCGLPVVAFDCPLGPACIIEDGKTGFLIPNRDKSLFAEKVCALIESYDLRKAMGKEGIVSSQRFSAGSIMPLWKDLFESLVSKSPA